MNFKNNTPPFIAIERNAAKYDSFYIFISLESTKDGTVIELTTPWS
jgi:hypothetical protein